MRLNLIIVILFICFNLFSQENWVLNKESDSIKVFTRITDKSPYKEFKAVTHINANIDSIIKVLNNVKAYSLWMSDVIESKTIKKVNDTLKYNYILLDIPWPLDNRDLIIKYQVSYNGYVYTANLNSTPDFIDKKEDIVRLNYGYGKWVLTKINNNRTSIQYQFLSDPEVIVPAWIINLFLVEGPYKTLKNLKLLFK